jgi:alcohol dehydrogenase
METNLFYDMYVPTRVMFGAGMLNKLGEQAMPGKKALIVISNGKSTRANGYLARTEEQLQKAGVASVVFDGVAPNVMLFCNGFSCIAFNQKPILGL